MDFGGRRGNGHANALAPRGEVCDHEPPLAQQALVGRGSGERDRSRGVETMTVGVASGAGVEERRGNDVAAEEHDHPVHRAHEHRLPLAPVHAPRNRQLIERPLHQGGQQLHRGLPGARADEEEKRPLALIEPLEGGDAAAAALGEGERGARRRATGIEGGAERGSASFQMLLGLRSGEALHVHGKSAGRGKTRNAPMVQPRLVEACGESCGEGLLERAQRLRRQLLGADLDQEVLVSAAHWPARAALPPGARLPACSASPAARRACGVFSSGKPSDSRLAR